MRHSDMAGVTWMGECPRCAEADRIAAAIEDAIEVGMNVKMQAGMARAAAIVRGET